MRHLDLATWPRRAAFEYFRGFDKPYFNVCVRLDVAPLKAALAARARARPGSASSFSLACHYITLKLAHAPEHEGFRLRLAGGRVRVLDRMDAGATVLRADESFSFAYLPAADDFDSFCGTARAAIDAALGPAAAFDPRVAESAVIHYTTLPWLHFTSFSHARQWGREDSVPKIAFGRVDAERGIHGPARQWMPFSLEVHHALVDGLHVGRYVQALEAALAAPAAWLTG